MANGPMKKRSRQKKTPRHAIRRQLDGRQCSPLQQLKAEDTVLFDFHLETPLTLEVDSLQLEFVILMRKADIRDELIYAYLRTGLIVTEKNYDYLTTEDRRAWDRALQEYARHFEGKK